MEIEHSLTDILKNSTVLYVEDELEIRKSVCKTLELICKNIIDVASVEEAKKIYEEQTINIILTDIELDGDSGIEFAKYIRNENKTIPIIIMSAYTEKDYLMDAVKLHLVDYLVKPIDFNDLLTTLKNSAETILENGDFTINFKNDVKYDILKNTIIKKNGEKLSLTNLEKKLLRILIKNKNRTVPTDEIKSYVWEDEYPSESALKSLLNKIRLKIGKESIENISGVGYHLLVKE